MKKVGGICCGRWVYIRKSSEGNADDAEPKVQGQVEIDHWSDDVSHDPSNSIILSATVHFYNYQSRFNTLACIHVKCPPR